MVHFSFLDLLWLASNISFNSLSDFNQIDTSFDWPLALVEIALEFPQLQEIHQSCSSHGAIVEVGTVFKHDVVVLGDVGELFD